MRAPRRHAICPVEQREIIEALKPIITKHKLSGTTLGRIADLARQEMAR